DVAVHLVTVGPVAFHGDEREPFLLDEPLADAGAPAVIFRSAVRSLSQQNRAHVADPLHQWIQIPIIIQRPFQLPDLLSTRFAGTRFGRCGGIAPQESFRGSHRSEPPSLSISRPQRSPITRT